jgi:hypothetical protein
MTWNDRVYQQLYAFCLKPRSFKMSSKGYIVRSSMPTGMKFQAQELNQEREFQTLQPSITSPVSQIA